MNLFSGLEKFGIEAEEDMNLFEEEKKPGTAEKVKEEVREDVHFEKEFLLEKAIRCPVCDKVFKTLMVKNGRVKRMEPDMDLRPRHQYVDTIKYNAASCPFCGYAALNTYFEHVTSIQKKLIEEKICNNFDPKALNGSTDAANGEWDYDTAVAMHKLSLYTTIVKKGKTSEKAYNCLMVSWLLRGMREKLEEARDVDDKRISEIRAEEEEFYKQAYDGFTKAMATELFPMCGMDQTTMEYLLATMAYHFGRLEVASKCLANIITSRTASRKVKDKALELKDRIIAEIKSRK